MSYFNEHQIAYMEYLNSLPREAKCKCGWYPRGDCYNCKPDDGGKARKLCDCGGELVGGIHKSNCTIYRRT